MKAKHRHELETNWLAKQLAGYIEQLRPYSSAILGAVVVAAVGVLGFSYFSGSSSARQREAWSSFNEAIIRPILSRVYLEQTLDMLNESAESYPQTAMQQWADITWADGQVMLASFDYVGNRAAAIETLNRATGTYLSLLDESDDERLTSRAHFGLGRVYELRGELDKAREEYLAVRGGFEQLAKLRAEALADPQTKQVYDWLATAEAPRRTAPGGPGTPGQRPIFSPGGLDIPAEGEGGTEDFSTSVEDLFRGFDLPDLPEDRYGTETEGADEAAADAPADGPQEP